MRSTTIWTVAIALLGITTGNSTATSGLSVQQCGSVYEPQNYPPGKQETGDYYHIAPNVIDDAIVEKVRDFTDKLDGDRWQGTALHTRCILAPYDTRTTITSFDVDAEIDKHFLGALVMELHQENAEELVLDQIWLSPETELDGSLDYSLDSDNPSKTHGQRTGNRNFRIDFSSPDTLVYNQKYRRIVKEADHVAPGLVINQLPRLPPDLKPDITDRDAQHRISELTMRVVHEIKTVSLNNSGLTISRDVYVDRRFVAQQQWQLVRI